MKETEIIKMRKGVIWGAGGTGRYVYKMSKDFIDIVCFVDSDETKWGYYRGIANKKSRYFARFKY